MTFRRRHAQFLKGFCALFGRREHTNPTCPERGSGSGAFQAGVRRNHIRRENFALSQAGELHSGRVIGQRSMQSLLVHVGFGDSVAVIVEGVSDGVDHFAAGELNFIARLNAENGQIVGENISHASDVVLAGDGRHIDGLVHDGLNLRGVPTRIAVILHSVGDFGRGEFSRRTEPFRLQGQRFHIRFNLPNIPVADILHTRQCLDLTHCRLESHSIVGGVFERRHNLARSVDGVLKVAVGIE